jgi:hypothetical protein
MDAPDRELSEEEQCVIGLLRTAADEAEKSARAA